MACGCLYLILLPVAFPSSDFIAIAFDASGATTGAVTVPFMLALAAGISAMKSDKSSEADSFGLVGISSTGAILGVLVTGLIFGIDKLNGVLPEETITSANLLEIYGSKLLPLAKESMVSLLPIVVVYILFQVFAFKQRRSRVFDIARGLALTFFGLVVFLLGVNGGFMEVGTRIGIQLASMESKVPTLVTALFLGLATVLAEPAVHVLTHQVESVTGGRRSRWFPFPPSCSGAVHFMSALRIFVPGLHYDVLLPDLGLLCSPTLCPSCRRDAFDAGALPDP